MFLIAISYHGRKEKTGSRGRSPQEIFESKAFQWKGGAIVEMRGSYKKEHFRSFVEKDSMKWIIPCVLWTMKREYCWLAVVVEPRVDSKDVHIQNHDISFLYLSFFSN